MQSASGPDMQHPAFVIYLYFSGKVSLKIRQQRGRRRLLGLLSGLDIPILM